MSQRAVVETLENRQLCSWVGVWGSAAMGAQALSQSPAGQGYKALGHYQRGIEVLWRNTNLQGTPLQWMDANRKVY